MYYVNNLLNITKDLENYSDYDLKLIANYLNINNKLPIKELKLLIAKNQLFNIKYSNLEYQVNIPERGIIKINESCLKGIEIKDFLGNGTTASVYKIIDKNLDKTIDYVVKLINLDASKDDYNSNNYKEIIKEKYINFNKEAEISLLFSSFNIGPKIYKYWICNDINIGVIITEKWDTTLREFTDGYEYKKRVSILCNKLLVDKLNNQINEIHKLGYIHYDIKPENILIKLDNKNEIIDITITDFGLTKSIEYKDAEFIKVLYNYHKRKYPDFFKKISINDLEKNPLLIDFGYIYELENCLI